MRTLGKLAKGAIHCLERGFVPVQTGDFLMINDELGILMSCFMFLSVMQFYPLATRLCPLHFVPEASSKANVCGCLGERLCEFCLCFAGSHVVNSSIVWFACGELEHLSRLGRVQDYDLIWVSLLS